MSSINNILRIGIHRKIRYAGKVVREKVRHDKHSIQGNPKRAKSHVEPNVESTRGRIPLQLLILWTHSDSW